MSKIADRLKRLVAGIEERHAFKLESAVLRFTRLLRQRMERIGMGPTELANRIEAKPPYVSKILRGNTNFTLDSLIKLCSAVDAKFEFDIVPNESPNTWAMRTVGEAHIGTVIISLNQPSAPFPVVPNWEELGSISPVRRRIGMTSPNTTRASCTEAQGATRNPHGMPEVPCYETKEFSYGR